MNKHSIYFHVTHAIHYQQTELNSIVQLQHVSTTQQNDPSYLLSAMFLTLFGLMEVKAVRCVLWQKLRRLHWGCECGVQAFCPAGVWGRQRSGLFPRPLQHEPCSSNLISTAACCSFTEAEWALIQSALTVWRVAPSAGESRQYKLPALSLWRFL